MRNQQQAAQTLPVGNDDQNGIDSPTSQSKAGSTTFENYLGKVIVSVQNRKKNPRLKSLFN